VVHGDTAVVQYGIGTFGSRGTAVAGSALFYALQDIKAKMKKFGAMMLGTEDVHFSSGRCLDEASGKSVTFAEGWQQPRITPSKLPPNTQPGLGGDAFLGAAELHLSPFGGAHRGHRDRSRYRCDRNHALRLRGRYRPHHQPADRRWPGARRRGAGARAGIVGGGRPSTMTQASLGQRRIDRLRAAEGEAGCRGSRAATPRRPSPVNPLGVKGVGEAGHHRLFARGGQLGGRRAFARLGVKHIDMPLTPGEDLETDSGGTRMIANQFTYHSPATLEEAFAMLEDGSGKNPRRRHEPDPTDEAAPGLARERGIDLRRIPGLKEISESDGGGCAWARWPRITRLRSRR